MKLQKGFIQIPILIAIIIGAVVIGGGGYFGVMQYQNYQTELERQNREIESLKDNQNTVIDSANEDSKNTETTKELSRADIIAQWTPNIAYIVCSFSLDPTAINSLRSYGVDTEPVVLSGSGFLLSITTKRGSGQIAIITNRHVLNAHNGFSDPSSCEATFPNGRKYFFTEGQSEMYYLNGGLEDERKFIDGQPIVIPPVDAGYLLIRNPDLYTNNLAKQPKICETSPRIGDDVIILGYPSIGSATGITATEGIVSGIENDYFVTSAKVEHGNSGGAAILKDQNCYFGIPTFARTGSVESFARILSFKRIFK